MRLRDLANERRSFRYRRLFILLCRARGNPRGSTASTSSTARRGWRCGGAEHGIDWHYIAPGKPMQNGFVESFNGFTLYECICKLSASEPERFGLDPTHQILESNT